MYKKKSVNGIIDVLKSTLPCNVRLDVSVENTQTCLVWTGFCGLAPFNVFVGGDSPAAFAQSLCSFVDYTDWANFLLRKAANGDVEAAMNGVAEFYGYLVGCAIRLFHDFDFECHYQTFAIKRLGDKSFSVSCRLCALDFTLPSGDYFNEAERLGENFIRNVHTLILMERDFLPSNKLCRIGGYAYMSRMAEMVFMFVKAAAQ